MSHKGIVTIGLAVLMTAGPILLIADSAAAWGRARSGTVTVQGAAGRGGTTQVDAYRSPGASSTSRSTTTNGGETYSTARSRASVKTENGVATSASRTGPAGNTQTYQGETTRTDDGYSRSSGVQTSQGRGYQTQTDVSHDEDSVTVDKSAVTNSGAAVSRSATVSRPQ
ncbi:hypothetical protein [Caulobacter sp. NIBR1757]|uniref:hypothetical protein n=1 Tax=Caulobacter sp. NIBR1757 TaxID=3016000 RepID=UPI0022F04A21|nr:hypothetical protein [Caulobacter sp. NIBR1757]WGM39899.1 hypothetical protein AMEJIAPC_02839 [Caulobacter sp. NIBR1757]